MISQNVVILTRDELRGIEAAAFKRGVARGKFEALVNAIEKPQARPDEQTAPQNKAEVPK